MYRGSSSFLPIVVPFRERSFFHSLHDASCKPPQTHTLTRTLAYVFSCSLRWISVCPSVIRFAPKSAKRFPTGGMARSSLAHDCSCGVCSSLFRPDFHQASTPLLRFRSGALNMRVCVRTMAFGAMAFVWFLAPLAMQRFALARTSSRE